MSNEQSPAESEKDRPLLSYLSPEEKHRLVGSFVIENFWDTFIEENSDPINRFRQLAKESIPGFIDAYQDVWDYVIDVNQLDDQFVFEILNQDAVFKGLSVEELKLGNKLLGLSLYSELEKDCLMALNKTILGELAKDMKEQYGLSDEEYQLLMTPSFETFFTKYHFDHFEYAINDDPETKEIQQEALIRNFHANDKELFELRFADMHFPAGDNLNNMLMMQKSALAERAAKKVAFIDDREDFVAFEKLLEYDNFLDFKYRYNLEACPEYYLRKMLFAECQQAGIFVEVDKPLSLQDPAFIAGVNELIELREQKYVIEPRFETNNRTFKDLEASSIAGSKDAIIAHLRQGSPVLMRASNSSQSSTSLDDITIVGYENGTLLARDGDSEPMLLDENSLDEFDDFIVLQKYDPEMIEDISASIDRFIERKPYLDRSGYEHAF